MQEETLPIDTIKYNSIPCNMLKELWSTLYSLYNSAYHYQVNKNILKELQPATTQPWYKFIAQELWDILKKCANNSIPSPNHVSQRYLKRIIIHNEYMANILNIANAYFNLGFWPSHFKQSTSIIVPKPNKTHYDTPKSFCSIVLLNTLGKLIEKAISHCIQFQAVQSAFLYPNQLGGIIQRSTTNAGSFITYTIQAEWTKQLKTSVIIFNIAQFFLFLNHEIMTNIIKLAGFDSKVVVFFKNYLTNRVTTYSWNHFSFPPFPASMGVGQESTFSPVLSALYLAPILYLFE